MKTALKNRCLYIRLHPANQNSSELNYTYLVFYSRKTTQKNTKIAYSSFSNTQKWFHDAGSVFSTFSLPFVSLEQILRSFQ